MSQVVAQVDVVMPQLSDSMTEGTVLSWLIADGELVADGTDLVEIETDKATMTYQSEAAGYLERMADEGGTYAVGAVIARLLPERPAAAANAPDDDDGEGVEGTSAPAPDPSEEAAGNPPGNGGRAPAANDAGSVPIGTPRGHRASPLARRLAAEHGVDLGAVSGSGPGGRITRNDVASVAGVGSEQRIRQPPPDPQIAAGAPAGRDASARAKGQVSVIEPTRVQQIVARRMAESKSTVPDFSMASDATVDQLLSLRRELRDRAAEDDIVPSLNDFVIKAVAVALARHRGLNAAYRDGRFELFDRINVGVAVAAPDGLFVPTIFDADQASLGTIARTMRDLAARARESALTPPELSGGTFTISNLGMFGIRDFSPIINPPQAAILGVGRVDRVAVEGENGSLVWTARMPLTLVGDHRILNGADAAQFVSSVRDALEAPLQLVL